MPRELTSRHQINCPRGVRLRAAVQGLIGDATVRFGRLDVLVNDAAYEKSLPFNLEVAAAIAYPDGSMTAVGLRREAKRGRLVIERTAGKDFLPRIGSGECNNLHSALIAPA